MFYHNENRTYSINDNVPLNHRMIDIRNVDK